MRVFARPEKNLGALFALSDISQPAMVAGVLKQIQEAPDPETATRLALAQLSAHSDTVTRKVRQTVWHIWARHHPRVPLVPHLSITSADVEDVLILQDARAYLAALAQEPAMVTRQHGEVLLAPAEVRRLQRALPSSLTTTAWPVESEWAYMRLRRLRAALQALRLIRITKGELTLSRSRYEHWQSFPATHQFYALWHADTYHTNWGEFASLWGAFLEVIQDNSGLLWEVSASSEGGDWHSAQRWYMEMIEAFLPLWQEAGLLEVAAGPRAWYAVLRQQSVVAALQRSILTDLFETYGLIRPRLQRGELGFSWTAIGTTLLPAEQSQKLPCAIEMLK